MSTSMDVDQAKPDAAGFLDRLSSASEADVRSAADKLRGLYERK